MELKPKPRGLSSANPGQVALFRSALAFLGRPIFAGPARRFRRVSIATRNRSDPNACCRCRCARIASSWSPSRASSKPGSGCTSHSTSCFLGRPIIRRAGASCSGAATQARKLESGGLSECATVWRANAKRQSKVRIDPAVSGFRGFFRSSRCLSCIKIAKAGISSCSNSFRIFECSCYLLIERQLASTR
jgi:hypothetical protein